MSAPQRWSPISYEGMAPAEDGGYVAFAEADAEITRLREWFEGVRDFAERCMPHAMGQGHLALMSLRDVARLALAGKTEGDFQYRNKADVIAEMAQRPAVDVEMCEHGKPWATCGKCINKNYCGCCGIECSGDWCRKCSPHVAKTGPMHERTFEAQSGKPCPFQE